MKRKNTALALTVLFFIIAVTNMMVIYADDRMVVKVAMFAVGTAFGASLVTFITGLRATSNAT